MDADWVEHYTALKLDLLHHIGEFGLEEFEKYVLENWSIEDILFFVDILTKTASLKQLEGDEPVFLTLFPKIAAFAILGLPRPDLSQCLSASDLCDDDHSQNGDAGKDKIEANKAAVMHYSGIIRVIQYVDDHSDTDIGFGLLFGITRHCAIYKFFIKVRIFCPSLYS